MSNNIENVHKLSLLIYRLEIGKPKYVIYFYLHGPEIIEFKKTGISRAEISINIEMYRKRNIDPKYRYKFIKISIFRKYRFFLPITNSYLVLL